MQNFKIGQHGRARARLAKCLAGTIGDAADHPLPRAGHHARFVEPKCDPGAPAGTPIAYCRLRLSRSSDLGVFALTLRKNMAAWPAERQCASSRGLSKRLDRGRSLGTRAESPATDPNGGTELRREMASQNRFGESPPPQSSTTQYGADLLGRTGGRDGDIQITGKRLDHPRCAPIGDDSGPHERGSGLPRPRDVSRREAARAMPSRSMSGMSGSRSRCSLSRLRQMNPL